MKIRNGFVSNSSSSSFVALINEDGMKELLDMAENEFEKKATKVLMFKTEQFNQTCYAFETWCSRDGGSSSEFTDWDDLVKGQDFNREELQDFEWTLHTRLGKVSKQNAFVHEQDW